MKYKKKFKRMKHYLIFIALFFSSSNVAAVEYTLNGNAEIIINEEIKINETIKESIIKAKGTYTDNLGNYGEIITLGTSKSDKQKVILDLLLEGKPKR